MGDIFLPYDCSDVKFDVTSLPLMQSGKTRFLKKLDSIELTGYRPVMILPGSSKSTKQEQGFDVLIVYALKEKDYKGSDDDRPPNMHLVFIDLKSKDDINAKNQEIVSKEASKRFARVQAMFNHSQSVDSFKSGGVGQAFRDGNYTYVYLSTHAGEGVSKVSEGGRMIATNRDMARGFFGPLWGFYSGVRSLYTTGRLD